MPMPAEGPSFSPPSSEERSGFPNSRSFSDIACPLGYKSPLRQLAKGFWHSAATGRNQMDFLRGLRALKTPTQRAQSVSVNFVFSLCSPQRTQRRGANSVLQVSVSLEALGLMVDPLKRELRPLPMVLALCH